MPKVNVSIVLPCYNVQKYLPRTIQCLLEQEMSAFEVWLIDDGSSDETKRICQNICSRDKRFHLLSTEHLGAAGARNVVLNQKLLQGKYVWFLDADDIPRPNFLSFMFVRAELLDSDIIFCNYRISTEETLLEPECLVDCDSLSKEEFLLNQFSLKTNKGVNGGFLWNKLIKLKCIADLKIPDFSASEDELFLYSLMPNVKKISFIGQSLYQYQIRVGQLSKKKNFTENFVLSRRHLCDNNTNDITLAAYFQAVLIYYSKIIKEHKIDDATIDSLKDLVKDVTRRIDNIENVLTFIDPKYVLLTKFLFLTKFPKRIFKIVIQMPIAKMYSLIRH